MLWLLGTQDAVRLDGSGTIIILQPNLPHKRGIPIYAVLSSLEEGQNKSMIYRILLWRKHLYIARISEEGNLEGIPDSLAGQRGQVFPFPQKVPTCSLLLPVGMNSSHSLIWEKGACVIELESKPAVCLGNLSHKILSLLLSREATKLVVDMFHR